MLSIRQLLAAVAFVAIGCASITYASSEWQLILRFFFCVGVLGCILALFYRRGERQAFCAGFLLFGLTFAVACWRLGSLDVRDVVLRYLRQS